MATVSNYATEGAVLSAARNEAERPAAAAPDVVLVSEEGKALLESGRAQGRLDADEVALALDELDLEGPARLVALRVGMLLGGRHEVVGEVVLVVAEPLVVGLAQLDRVEVGDHGPAVAEQCCAVVHGPADRGGDLDRLDLRLERLGEGTVDSLGETVLDTVDDSHAVSSSW